MKNVFFIRHGKSSWEHDVTDVERPLQSRGYKDGELIGKEFASWRVSIDAVFSSPAKRAFTTCQLICEELSYPLDKVIVTKELYDFDGESVLQFLKNLDDKLKTVVIFGHNHAFTALVNQLGNMPIANVPTTGLVCISFKEETWKQIVSGITKHKIFPKELK